MQELVVDMKHHYSNFDITPQHLGLERVVDVLNAK
jgi:hypothetical protein